MRLRIRRNQLFWVGASLFFIGLALLLLPPYGRYCGSQSGGDYYCTAYGVAIALGEWVELHDGAVTAIATGVIAWFTITIWIINRRQLTHANKVERAYISGGGAQEIQRRHRGTRTDNSQIGNVVTVDLGYEEISTGNFVVCVNNYGKTPGELYWVGIGFCDADSVPGGEPSYKFVYRHDWIQPGDRGRPIFPEPIPNDSRATAVFGRFYYRDIFGGKHSSGFINRIEGPRQSDPLLAPAAYTNQRDETNNSTF